MYTDQIIQDCYEKLIPVYEKHLKFEKVNSFFGKNLKKSKKRVDF